ncbi:glycosyl transferase family 1 [Duganella rhizosphaerae]|uniref:glycosyltransferase family 4 protein n=1 Tax=Duganella rhizosphaerae TaxID=2885763 RepID=UPI0030E9047A
MRRPRLLHVFSTFDVGGPQVRVTRMIEHWGAGVEHWICAHDGRYGAQALLAAASTASLVRDVPLKQRGMWQRLRRLGAYLRAAPVDLVCTYNWGAMDVLLANRLFGRRSLVHHEEGFEVAEAARQNRLRSAYRRLTYPGASKIVTVSRNLEAIARDVWRQPGGRMVYVPNGVDVAGFSTPPRADAIPGFARRPGEIVIGCVARLNAVKNLTLLVRAVARLAGQFDVRLVIVGEGPQAGAILDAAGECGLGDRLVLPGFVPHPQNYVGLFDIFAMSSFSEQFPLSLVEAMAAALPCACTDVGDCMDIMPDVSRRFVSRSGDEDGLVLSLGQLAASAALRCALGQANRAEIAARFSMADMMRRYSDVYRSVADGSMPAS